MSPERKPTRDEQFSVPHGNIIKDLSRLPKPDLDFFRQKFKAGEFGSADAYMFGTRLIHAQNNGYYAEFIILGMAYLSQAVELNLGNSFYKWVLRHEKRTHKIIETEKTGAPLTPTEENFLDFTAIARYREESRKTKPQFKKRTRMR